MRHASNSTGGDDFASPRDSRNVTVLRAHAPDGVVIDDGVDGVGPNEALPVAVDNSAMSRGSGRSVERGAKTPHSMQRPQASLVPFTMARLNLTLHSRGGGF